MSKSLKELILAAEFAAIIAVLSPFTIPLAFVPITLQTFAVGLVITVLGPRVGTMAVLIYLLLGVIGLPVFAGGESGIQAIVGPTGGYLVGFIFNGLLTGLILEKTAYTHFWAVVANLAGAIVTLLFGTCWLKFSADLNWLAAFNGGFTPFVLGGVIKAVAAAYIGILIGNRLPANMTMRKA